MTIIVTTAASASTRNYDWLKTALSQWNGNRADLTPMIPDFVMLAEKRLNSDLEARLQESIATLLATAGNAAVAIPDDFAELRSLSIPGGLPLEYLTPGQYDAKAASKTTGLPRYYASIGSAIYLYPTPEADVSLGASYRAYVPPLADSAGSNWLIQQHPNVYLAASMCEALSYTKNWAELPAWEKKYADAINSVNKPDWFSGSTMRVRSDVRI